MFQLQKKEFIELGKRHDNLETIRDSPPMGMGVENWRNTIDLFGDPKYKKRCEVNKKNREKQLFANRGGSASYSSWSFKKNVEALETYAHAHTLPDGTFASPLEEENFNFHNRMSIRVVAFNSNETSTLVIEFVYIHGLSFNCL
ncbi:hypothetical protein Hanom_Chr04g00336291 [Helianthus anomalus]